MTRSTWPVVMDDQLHHSGRQATIHRPARFRWVTRMNYAHPHVAPPGHDWMLPTRNPVRAWWAAQRWVTRAVALGERRAVTPTRYIIGADLARDPFDTRLALVAIRYEERIALGVRRPEVFVLSNTYL